MLDRRKLDEAFNEEYKDCLEEVNKQNEGYTKEIILVPIVVEVPDGAEKIGCLTHTNIMKIYNRKVRNKNAR